MDEKKNIERLFQEKFKDFESTPPNHVWSNIQSSLDKKGKKRNVIPIWWKLGGAAAALALLFILSGLFQNTPNDTIQPNNNIITNINDSIQEKNGEKANNKTTGNTPEAIVEKENDGLKNSENDLNKEEVNSILSSSSKSNVANNEKENTETPSLNNNKAGNDIHNSNTIPQNNKSEIAHNIPSGEANEVVPNTTPSQAKNAIAETTNEREQNKEQTADSSEDKKSLLDFVDEMEKAKEEEALAHTNQEKSSKWTVNPNIAPVYYNSLSKGSPINTDFSNNSKNGDVNMSYGINVAYNVGKRLSIRSGVNSVNMGYTTNDVQFGPSVFNASQSASNITFKNSASALNVSDQKTPSANFNDEIQSKNEVVSSGSMDQKFGYLEVPMELKYRLVDKRFGVNLIGGFSSLFLTNNEVSFQTNNMATEVGEANNLNDLSFSTNIGLGLDYQVTNKLLFNLEPMFKYQLNTFSREDGGFSPYLLGVYTGLSFKF